MVLRVCLLSIVLTLRVFSFIVTPDLEVVKVSNVGFTFQSVNLENTYTDAIPVCTYNLPGFVDNPAYPRITNITSNSFELRIQGPENSSSITSSNVYCIIVDEGDYTLSNGFQFEAHKVSSTDTSGNSADGWTGTGEDISSDIVNTYTNPLVLGSVISSNDSKFSAFWSYDCDSAGNRPFLSGMADGICVGKHVAQLTNTNTNLRTDEDLGYIIVEGDVDGGGVDTNGSFGNGNEYEIALGANSIDGVDNSGNSYTLAGPSSGSYTLAIATGAAMDGGNGGWSVLFGATPITNSAITLGIDEDTIGDTERAHLAEQVAYWVMESDANLSFMEIQSISSVGYSFTTVNFNNTYTNPIPVCTYHLTSNTNNEAVVRIDNLSSTSMDIKIQRPQDSSAVTSGTVYCMIVEDGNHTLPDGRILEAGRVTSNGTNENNNWGSAQMEQITPTNSYTSPIVFGQVITYNDNRFSTFWTSDGTQTGVPTAFNIFVGKTISEDTGGAKIRANETLGYIVLETNTSEINKIKYKSALTSDTVRGVGDSPPYTFALGDLYTFGVATQEAMDGTDGGWAIFFGSNPLSSNQINLAIDEDIVTDTETSHTTEEVAYWVFEPLADLNLSKTSSVFSDPVNTTSNPKRIPGSIIEYTITATNDGYGDVDTGTTVIIDHINPRTSLCVANTADCITPSFTNGTPTSGVSLNTISYSNDNGSSFSYTPTADTFGVDSNVTDVNITFSNIFVGKVTDGNEPNFDVKLRVQVK